MSANPVPAQPLEPVPIQISLTGRQLQMYNHPARTLYIGAGTKTGKTFALMTKVATLLLEGKKTAWCGPWRQRNFKPYEEVLKPILRYAEKIGAVRFNDSAISARSETGGVFDTFVGENPQGIAGGEYDFFVIDEASRQTALTLEYARTTVAVRKGDIRLAFNLEHGMANWAVRALVKVRDSMTAEQRLREGVDYMLFPTLGEGFVDAEEIELARRDYTPQRFEALYNAVIPASDTALFRNLDRVFSGKPISGPIKDHSYIMGVDLARTQDWTVATVFDVQDKTAVDAVRFQQISWTLQYERLAELYRKWRCGKAVVDQNGVGDPVVEELEHRGMRVEGLKWGESARTMLLEELVIACDSVQVLIVDDARFAHHRSELEKFEYQLDRERGKVKIAVADGFHDDCVFSLALGWHGLKLGNFGAPRFARGDTSRIHVSDYSDF